MIDKLLLEHVGLPHVDVHSPCDFSVSPSPFDLDFGTLDSGTSDSALTMSALDNFVPNGQIDRQTDGQSDT